MMLLGSGTEVVVELLLLLLLLAVPKTVNASEGMEPTLFSEACDIPEFSSQ